MRVGMSAALGGQSCAGWWLCGREVTRRLLGFKGVSVDDVASPELDLAPRCLEVRDANFEAIELSGRDVQNLHPARWTREPFLDDEPLGRPEP